MGRIDRRKVRARLDDVIAAMKGGGAWEVPCPAKEAFVDMGAFGMRTMAFEQWLRWVFVPSIEGRWAQDGPWPDDSQVGVHAVRETDGNDVLQPLVTALMRFDELFQKPPEPVAQEDEGTDHEVRARAELPRGLARHALTSLRRAVAASRDPARREAYRTEHANLEAALRAQRVWFPSERAELRWLAQDEGLDPPFRETLPAQVDAAIALLPAEEGVEVLRLSLQTVAESARDDTMPVALIGCDWGLEVEAVLAGLAPSAREAVGRVAHTWDRFLRAVWALATESENPIVASDPFAGVRQLLFAAHFDEALAALDAAAPSSSCDTARVADGGAVRARVHGTRAQALALMGCACRAVRECARRAPGREAGEAYEDVQRLDARLAAWLAEA